MGFEVLSTAEKINMTPEALLEELRRAILTKVKQNVSVIETALDVDDHTTLLAAKYELTYCAYDLGSLLHEYAQINSAEFVWQKQQIHDYRNFLTPVIGYIELHVNGLGDRKEIIKSKLVPLKEVGEEFFSPSVKEKYVFEKISSFLQNRQFEQTGITLNNADLSDLHSDLEVRVQKLNFLRVIGNLSTNAMREHQLAGIEQNIVISSHVDANHRYAYLVVTDFGNGGLRPHHFQNGASEHIGNGGNGFGLASSLAIIKNNGLRIDYSSRGAGYLMEAIDSQHIPFMTPRWVLEKLGKAPDTGTQIIITIPLYNLNAPTSQAEMPTVAAAVA